MKIETIQKALEKQLNFVPTKITVLDGESRRPNSWTFKVSSMSGDKVVKVIKPRKDVDPIAEKTALEKLGQRSDIDVVKLESSEELVMGNESFTYFVFPFISGDNLLTKVKNGGKCSEDEGLEILDWLLQNINNIWGEGILHQDIKPANILKTEENKYVLLDFGIARFYELNKESVDKLQGPARYLSPEQATLAQEKPQHYRRRIGLMSDIYSAAATVLELVVGSDKFNDFWKLGERPEVTEKIRNETVSKIYNPKLREKLADCLEYSPSIRLERCVNEGYFSFPLPVSIPELFLLQHYSGFEFIKQFVGDAPGKKLGAIFLAEYMSTKNTGAFIGRLEEDDWYRLVDPSTHKLISTDGELHAKLKNYDYYRPGISAGDLITSEFKEKFVKDVIEFQLRFKPSAVISPYFYIKNAKDDQYLDWTIQLFIDCKKYIINQKKETPLFMGICIAENLIKNSEQRLLLIDQLITLRDAGALYIKAELIKKDNSPCHDTEYLTGLKEIAEILGKTKRIIFSQVDQSSLGVITSDNVSVAVNPELGLRKNSIEDRIKGTAKGGFAKAEYKKYKYYMPKLLNDLDIEREYMAQDISKFIDDHSLRCQCPYCKGNQIEKSTEAKIKKLHFVHTFSDQVTGVREADDPNKRFGEMIEEAEALYSEMDQAGIKIEGESGGGFLAAWRDTFLK